MYLTIQVLQLVAQKCPHLLVLDMDSLQWNVSSSDLLKAIKNLPRLQELSVVGLPTEDLISHIRDVGGKNIR